MSAPHVAIVETPEGAFLSISWPGAVPAMIALTDERLAALAADAALCLRHRIQMGGAGRAPPSIPPRR